MAQRCVLGGASTFYRDDVPFGISWFFAKETPITLGEACLPLLAWLAFCHIKGA